VTTEIERRQVIYSGRVQGVGFRYTASQIAQSYAVTGFVRNRDDGRVELVAEGTPEELDRFLTQLASRMTSYIRSAEATTSPPTGQYTAFEIAY
jgi:acylphosphatase